MAPSLAAATRALAGYGLRAAFRLDMFAIRLGGSRRPCPSWTGRPAQKFGGAIRVVEVGSARAFMDAANVRFYTLAE